MEQVKQYVVADGLIDLGVKDGTFVRLEDYAALQQKLDAVLAENVALKDGIAKANAAVEHWNSWADKEDKISLHIKTPATDAILNEVRAEGVEMYAQSLRRKQEDAFTESEYRHTKLGRAAVSAEKFAAQLRSGSTEGGDE